MQHLARRLVWGAGIAGDPPHKAGSTFRIAEDATLSDATDAHYTLPENARINIVHPMVLSPDDKMRWEGILSDYEIIQPFGQLAREQFVPTQEERGISTSKRWVGQLAKGARFFSLQHRGWTFVDYGLGKSVGSDGFDVTASLHTDPGLEFLAGRPEDQTLGELSLRGTNAVGSAATFGDLHAVVVSELFRDIDALLR
jgi:Domain of unknown function (DUF4132)